MQMGPRIALYIAIASLTMPVFGQLTTDPHFGNGVVVLTLADNQLFRDPVWSPSGDLIFTHAALYGRREVEVPPEPFLGGSQYVWDLRGLELAGELTYLQPAQQLRLDDTEWGHGWAFSQDGQYLAIGTPTDLRVFSLPDLELHRTAPIIVNDEYSPSDNLIWSADSHFLAVLENRDIVVWDVEAETVSRHTLERPYQNVKAMGTGWSGYRSSYEQVSENGLFVCTLSLDNCSEYEFAFWPFFVAAAHSGETIVVQKGSHLSDEGGTIQVWQRQPDEEYRLEETELNTNQVGCPRDFSPSDHYLLMACDPRVWSISTFPSFAPILPLPFGDRPAWLPGEEYLVAFNPFDMLLNIYSLHSEEPADVLDIGLLSGEERDSWVDWEATTSQFPDVSADGRWVMINLGWAALVVPIEYD